MRGYIRRRGTQSWQISVELPADPVTGTRRRTFRSVKGTKRDAECELTALSRSVDTGVYVEPGRETVASFLRRWLRDYAQSNVAPRTYQRYVGIVDEHFVPALGGFRLADSSRVRLVTAQDQERRRLERDLHDGAQQILVAVKIKLGLAEALLDKDPARAVRTLSEVTSDADEALETLRDLTRGIYPPLLADRVLRAALEAQARKASTPTSVVATDLPRFPRDIEAAVYFCCLDALQNVQKYAGAERVVVTLTSADNEVAFTVDDNGRGFDPASVVRGAGVANMGDRIDALGGQLDVASTPGGGTRVTGVLPLAVGSAPGAR